ncbi:MFS transporter [Aestuariibacter sp. A3R04]|uniref:MFS transporter n=1 Tax=Aestuariibacter sp. A3R04 TaxID=2841571 RepID=UPI0020918AC4|nr:MFS transporter [Aestuariibacter sp. A3R04]
MSDDNQGRPGLPSPRILAGLAGIFISAMMAGLNSRLGALGLVDVQGALGFSGDAASWATTSYLSGEMLITPFASWFAITFSIRLFHRYLVGIISLIALCLPFIHNINLFVGLRFIQGVASGALVPLLMMMALKALPVNIRLHGLALYAMTATFSPNIAVWLSGQISDGVHAWQWTYWHTIPLCFLAFALVSWGAPKESVKVGRFAQANWLGMGAGMLSLGLLTVALSQGERLDWFNSSLISLCVINGVVFLAMFLWLEWHHPSPFIDLRLLSRRNLGLGSIVFVLLLVVLMTATTLPMNFLSAVQDYRVYQAAPLALIIGVPQLVLGSLVALALYKKWIDARKVFAVGLLLIAAACFVAANVDTAWHRDQFYFAQILQMAGQPMAVVSMLFLMTSVVQPHEGPYFSGIINTLRVIGTLVGSTIVARLMTVRGQFHGEALRGHAAMVPVQSTENLSELIATESIALSVADIYVLAGICALLMTVVVLRMAYIPAPSTTN